MRTLLSLVVVVVIGSAGVARAQPGQTPVAPPPPPAPYGQPPQQQVPPPYGYQPQPIPLTPAEHELLARGEISDGAHLGGGFAAVFLGFGIGQAVQGRWSDTGWIFTLGEGAALTAFIVGAAQAYCIHDCSGFDDDNGVGLMVGGAIAYLVLHVWEIVDAFAAPVSHNRKVRELRLRTGYQPMYYGGRPRMVPFVAPTHGNAGGGVAGVSLRF